MDPKTKVIFRKWSNGDVCALMPEIPADVAGIYCTSYERVGQHGSADPSGVIDQTTPATPKEYAPLARELRRIGYRLTIRKRVSRNAYQLRRAAIERARNLPKT